MAVMKRLQRRLTTYLVLRQLRRSMKKLRNLHNKLMTEIPTEVDDALAMMEQALPQIAAGLKQLEKRDDPAVFADIKKMIDPIKETLNRVKVVLSA